ncbi:MAG: AAA family ATPase [Rickettsiales bacterium]
MTAGPSLSSKPASSFLAFLTDTASQEAIRTCAPKFGWPADCLRHGTVVDAIAFLKEHKTPAFLMVEVPSAAEAPALLDQLAEICDPNVKLIVTGTVNEFSFYSWLMEIGAFTYLLEPFTDAVLENAIKKGTQSVKPETHEKKKGTVITFLGARGGVGTSTIASNLALTISRDMGKRTALLDLDPYFGTIAMNFDVDPTRELHTLLENPERIDGLFLDRVMIRINDNLDILSAEIPFKENITVKTEAADVLLSRVREKYDLILVDIPRALTPFTRAVLLQTDRIALISDPTLLSLRDLLRHHDLIKDTLRKPLPIVISNKAGFAPKHEIAKVDFEKHYGRPLDAYIPYAPEAISAAANGEMLLDASKNAGIKSAYKTLAELITGETSEPVAKTKKSVFFSKSKGS